MARPGPVPSEAEARGLLCDVTWARRAEILLALPAYVASRGATSANGTGQHEKQKVDATARALSISERDLLRWLAAAREYAAFGLTWPKGSNVAVRALRVPDCMKSRRHARVRFVVWTWLCEQRKERGVA